MSKGRFQFSLSGLFALITIAAVIAWFSVVLRNARHDAYLDSYGHRRFSRWQAEVMHKGPLTNLPDAEFLESDNPNNGPQRGQPWP